MKCLAWQYTFYRQSLNCVLVTLYWTRVIQINYWHCGVQNYLTSLLCIQKSLEHPQIGLITLHLSNHGHQKASKYVHETQDSKSWKLIWNSTLLMNLMHRLGHRKVPPVMPYEWSFTKRRLWGTETKAFEKSKAATSVLVPESRLLALVISNVCILL